MFDKSPKELLVESIREEIKPSIHYHGDMVRKLFIATAIIMIIALPFSQKYLELPVIYSLITVLILTSAAGLTNPKIIWTIVIDSLIAGIGFCFFEYQAVRLYINDQKIIISLINQAFSIMLLFAFYFGIRTLRWLKVSHLN